MKKIATVLLVLCMGLSLFGCKDEPAPDVPKPQKDLVTVYRLVSATTYEADGSRGSYHKTYTYDDRGMLLTAETDYGISTETFDEDLQVYIYDTGPYDDIPDAIVRHTYDDQGSLINTVATNIKIGDDGERVEQNVENYTAQKFSYQYDEDGKILSRTAHVVELDGSAGEKTWQMLYRYDENGKLYRVESEPADGGALKLAYKFSYDEEGRLAEGYYYSKEWARCFRYEYDEEGRVVRSAWASAPAQAVEDETMGFFDRASVEFEYDSKGNVLSRKHYDADGDLMSSVVCEYTTTGKLDSVCYLGSDGNLRDAITYTHALGGQVDCEWKHMDDAGEVTTTQLRYDERGELIRVTEQDGTYTDYEYEAMKVTKEDAAKFDRVRYLRERMDIDGGCHYTFGYSAGMELFTQIPYPEAPLYQADMIVKDRV